MRLTLASGITLARLFFLPPLIFLLWHEPRWPAFILLLWVLLLDLADGALARLRREVTQLGKFLDPIVDKLVFLAVFAALVWSGDLPWETLVLLMSLQMALLFGALLWLRQRRDVPAARPLGKVASFVLSLGLLTAVLRLPYHLEIVYGGMALAYLAGLDYLIRLLRVLRSRSNRAGIPAEEERSPPASALPSDE